MTYSRWVQRLLLRGATVAVCFSTAIASSAPPDLCRDGFVSPYPPVRPAVVGLPELYECEWAPMPVVSLDAQSKYDQDDPNKDQLDAAAAAAFEAEVEDLRAYQRLLVRAANESRRNPEQAVSAIECTTNYLLDWVRADALSDMQSHTAQQHRSVYVATMALAWLQVRDRVLHDSHHQEISDWLLRRADEIVVYFDGRTDKVSGQNNHRYWAGLAVAASAQITGNCDHYDWGVSTLDLAAGQVTPFGFLPHELDRGQRARDYHLYALSPLMMIAMMEHNAGRDPFARNNGALAHLVEQSIHSIFDPTLIEEFAGETQIELRGDNGLPRGHQIAWMELVHRMRPDLLNEIDLDAIRPLSFSSLGGNLTVLLEHTGGET